MKLKKIIKKIYKHIIKFLKKNKNIIFMALPFLVMDITIRLLGNKINFYPVYEIIPNLFTLLWTTFFITISLSVRKKLSKLVYSIFFFVSFSFFLTNGIYYSMTSSYFDFSLLGMASEGSGYIIDAIKTGNKIIYLMAIVVILLYILARKYFKEKTRVTANYKRILQILVIFAVIHALIPLLYGKSNSTLTWNTWSNPRDIYNNFNDNNKSMRISGLYEYTTRNFYITYLKAKKANNVKELEFLNEVYSIEEPPYQTNYTGMFEGKNVIYLQLEGIDEWLLDEETMPTLYNMQNNALNFINHYSYYNGGGSTFNSEFAVNTGFLTPVSYNQNAYTFSRNNFDYSMARLFKKKGYSVNAFHMNTKEYYSRGANYDNWGYDNYYGLKDQNTYTDNSYILDRELILNEKFSELLFPTDKPFVDYIISYSNHMPFTNTKGVCQLLLEKQKEEILASDPNAVIEEKTYTEEECSRLQARETDNMINLLITKLRDNNLLENTVIVAFADHYLYTLTDQNILAQYKETNNNLINHTPFLIWKDGMKKQTIKEVTSQLNILPTTINLFGLEYHPNYYIGSDALNPDYKGYVFFPDYSWYDGNVYVEGGVVTNGKEIEPTALEEKNHYINYVIKKNDLTLKYNYFKYINQNHE